ARSLLTFPSVKAINEKSSVEEFKTVVYDYVCATYKDKTKFDKCVAGIEAAIARGDNVFQTMPGPELNCNFQTCNATVVCKEKKFFGEGPKAGSCKLNVTIQPNPTNAANEVLSLLKGFNSLRK
ncbi:MAG: hypothetical protein K2Q18_19075, partial [Bdellovibrionales bacterium]|nr:hypothetical protein [Bdellovibrionales bacterium]